MVKNQIFQFSLQAPDNGKRAFNYEFRETASVKVTDHREVEELKSYKFRQRGQQDMEHQSGVISTQAAGVTENSVDSSHLNLERFSTSMPSAIFLAAF